MAEERVRGHLVIQVAEASGVAKQKGGPPLWDPALTSAFVKVEVRGGPRNVKAQTKLRNIYDNLLVVNEPLKLEVLEGANELRLMLCKEKRSQGRLGSSVVAACGIYVNDIIEAVPIDKYFELFKPKGGGDGGFIRISMDFIPAGADAAKQEDNRPLLQHSLTLSKEVQASDAAPAAAAANGEAAGGAAEAKKKKGGFPWKCVLALVAVGAAVAGGVAVSSAKQEKKQQQSDDE